MISDIKVLIFALLTFLWLAEFKIIPSSKHPSVSGRGSFYLVLAGIVSSIIFSIILNLNEVFLITGSIGEAVKNAGLIFYAGGVFLRYWSSLLLGENFSRNIRASKDQRLVSKGPYRFFRHPLYIALLIMVVAVSMFLQSPTGIVFSAIVMGAVLGIRIKEEEKIMEENIGQRYIDWKKKRYFILPYIF